MSVAYDPFAPEFRDDPFPVYRQLRDQAPVHWAPDAGCYCVSRYDDVVAVLKDTESFSSRAMFTVLMNGGEEDMPPLNWKAIKFIVRYALQTRLNPFGFPTARNLIAADPPAHGPMRNVVNRGFTPRRIAEWEPRIREVVSTLVVDLRQAKSFDVVRDLAVPLPVQIIAEMLGVESDRVGDFKRWSDGIIAGATGERRSDRFHPETVRTILELNGYLRKIVKQRRKNPKDDLVSVIAATDPGGDRLSVLELVMFVQLLLVAGNETTTNLIGNAVSALFDHPEQLERVSKDTALVPALLDETLRWDSPIQMVFRTATREVEVAETRIPKGAQLAVLIGSANRDERRFENPDVFDLDRNTQGHLAFGLGQHFCLGSSLAKLEARAALEALAPELLRVERGSARRELLDSFLVRGPRRLELRPAA